MIVNLLRRVSIILAAVALIPISFSYANSSAPSTTDVNKRALFQALARAENEQEGRIAEGDIWQYWFNQSPTAEVRASLDAGIARREAYDYEAAETHLDRVVELAPDYAEGYNQRAFVRFLRENYADAQTDLVTVLELEPDHFGALSGLYHILRIQNRQQAAMNLLKKAVSIHPWLIERSALPEPMWPKNYRDIHRPEQEI